MPFLICSTWWTSKQNYNFRISAENILSTFNIQFLFFVCWQTKKSKLWMLLQQTFSNPDSLSIVLVFLSIIRTCQLFISALSSKLFYFLFEGIKFLDCHCLLAFKYLTYFALSVLSLFLLFYATHFSLICGYTTEFIYINIMRNLKRWAPSAICSFFVWDSHQKYLQCIILIFG